MVEVISAMKNEIAFLITICANNVYNSPELFITICSTTSVSVSVLLSRIEFLFVEKWNNEILENGLEMWELCVQLSKWYNVKVLYVSTINMLK